MTIFSNVDPPPTPFLKLDRDRMIIIYNYFKGKLRIFYITMRVPGNPWLSKIFTFLKKYLYTISSSFEKKMREICSLKVRRVVILLNSRKERNLTERPSDGRIIGLLRW